MSKIVRVETSRFYDRQPEICRVPMGTGKHGKWLKKNPCMEKSWNLNNDEISWNFVKKCQFGCLWDSFFSSLASLAR